MWNILSNWIKRFQTNTGEGPLRPVEIPNRMETKVHKGKVLDEHIRKCSAQGPDNFYIQAAEANIQNLLTVRLLFENDEANGNEFYQMPKDDFLLRMARSRNSRIKFINSAIPILVCKTDWSADMMETTQSALRSLSIKETLNGDSEFITWAYVTFKITKRPIDEILWAAMMQSRSRRDFYSAS